MLCLMLHNIIQQKMTCIKVVIFQNVAAKKSTNRVIRSVKYSSVS